MSDAQVLTEIERLKAAIDRARNQPAQPSYQRGRGSSRGRASSQRGRGVSYARGGNRSLVLNKPPLASTPAIAQPDAFSTPAFKSRSFVSVRATENVPPVASTSREVIIDGVTFVSNPGGKKLVRRGLVEASSSSAVATPPRASVGGQEYVRTKNGNLVSLALVNKRASDDKVRRMNAMINSTRPFAGGRGSPRKRGPGRPLKKVNEMCRFFTTTGQCRSGLTCIYQHDPDKLALCPRFLPGKCTLGDACPLSHTADGHRMPHCVHFPNCKHGAACRFPHVHVSVNAGICRAFAVLGFCAKGLACPERHVRECPEFSEKGTCLTANCRLPHIIRKRAVDEAASAMQIEYASDSDEGAAEPDAEMSMAGKRKLSFEADEVPQVIIKRKRRLHDKVAEQADFVNFDDSFDLSQTDSLVPSDNEEEDDKFSDVDSDDFGGSD